MVSVKATTLSNQTELSAQQQADLDARVKEIDGLLVNSIKHTVKADHKIELVFQGKRSISQPMIGAMAIWESGQKLHGGGDGAMYFCPGKQVGKNNCEGLIRSACIGGGHMICPHCHSLWNAEQMNSILVACLPAQKWAEVVYKYYCLLGHNADIYMKHVADDIREIIAKDESKHANGEIMTMSQGKIKLHIYPLANIIKDTAAGASVLTRINSFLVS